MVKIEIGHDSLEYKLESERCRDSRSIFHFMNMAHGAFPHAKWSHFEVLCNSKAISPLEFFHKQCYLRCCMT